MRETTDTGETAKGKARLWTAEASVRFTYPYLDEFEKRFGAEICNGFLRNWDTDLEDLRRDETRWVSIAFLDALCIELVERTGSEEIIDHCGRLGVKPRYIGAIYPILRILGSPGMFYKGLPKLSSSVNKVNRVEMQPLGRGEARVIYHHGDVRESTRHVCTARKAQLAAIPGTWGLPDAQLEETECIHDGGEACRYHIRWQERVPALGSLLGLLLGVALALLVPRAQTAWLTPYLIALLGLATGLVLDCIRKHREARRFAEEQNQSLLQLLTFSEDNFQRILDERKRRHAAEDEADLLTQQLLQAQKLETIGQLAGGVAHDFNNLLTLINSHASFALEDLPENSGSRPDVEQILQAGQSAASLTRQLLAFSRRQDMKPVPLDLNQAIRELEKMLCRLLGETIQLESDLRDGLKPVFVDPGQLQQVLMNLAVNARDAMARGGVLRVETEPVTIPPSSPLCDQGLSPGDYAQVRVRDTGEGMDETTSLRIFEPFFTTKEKGRGTGLGLATVYGIIKQSGGHIQVESSPGAGSEFIIHLPILEESVERAPGDEAPAGKGEGESILLVEDDGAVRKLAARILKSAGYQVLEAASAEEAETLFEENADDIQLLLTDVVMPGRSGRELADALARRDPQLKSVFMSGYPQDELGPPGELEQGIQLIHKPFSPESLTRAIRTALDEGGAGKAGRAPYSAK